MQSNDGNSQYYLYAYRSGNTPGNVVNAFSMANSNSSDTFAWYKPDLDLSGRTDWEFADNRILVYKRDNVTRNRISDKEYFNEIKTFADKFLLKNDGFSVIELNRNQLRSLSTPANSIHNASKSLINTDSINGSLPQSTDTMNVLYDKHKDQDGFLYIQYSGENTFGTKNMRMETSNSVLENSYN